MRSSRFLRHRVASGNREQRVGFGAAVDQCPHARRDLRIEHLIAERAMKLYWH